MARSIKDYFQQHGQKRALDAYASFAGGAAWSLSMKMDLYVASHTAFDPVIEDAEAFKAFETIYGNLVSHWQVFRPHGADESWPARRIFDTIKQQFAGFGWGGPVSLSNVLSTGKHQVLMFSLMEMEGIKPNNGYPIMTVSKFLHFYNPGLFPIYDTEVIWHRVFKQFKKEYDAFRSSNNLESRAGGVAFLRNYLCWASSLMESAHPEFMTTFVDWLGGELPSRKFDALGRETLATLFATAFEFTAIGAAVAEGA